MENNINEEIIIDEYLKAGLHQFSMVNSQRSNQFFNGQSLEDTYYTTALAEEVGEICGVVKKLSRGFNERELLKARKNFIACHPGITPDSIPGADFFRAHWYKDKVSKLSGEIADVFIYLDLFAHKHGINIFEAVEKKFNQVTQEMKPQK